MPSQWDLPPTTQASAAVRQPLRLEQWWKRFDDPELDSLVDRAVAQNLDLQAAVERIHAARAAVGAAVSGLMPSVYSAGNYYRSGGARMPWSSDWTATLNGALSVDIFGGVRRTIEQGNDSLDAAVEDRRSVLVTLLSDVATDYITLRGEQQEVAIGRSNLEVEIHNAKLTRDKKRLGTGTDLDIAQADAQVSSTEATIESLQASAQETIYAISVLLALPPTALNPELSPIGRIPDPPGEVPVGLPSDLLRRRPDIREAERQLAAANAGIGIAVADLFPKFSLTGDVGLQGRRIDLAANWDSSFWTFGPGVTWSVLDSGQILSNIQYQGALTEQAVTAYRKTVLNALLDVQSVLVSYAAEQHRRIALAEAVHENQEAVRLSARRYEQGLTDFLSVLDAERSLFAAQDALVVSNEAVGNDAVALYRALGGGWENEEDAATTQPAGR